MARYDCPHSNHSVAVPFSCKTRLFCPSCHDLKTLLWIEAMFKKGVLTPDVANNLASWRHSGFHVHASSPLMPADGDLLRTRLVYAFRPPVALGRMDFDGTTVTVRTQKKQLLQLSPTDFLAKLTTHIPDRYQNIRRYAGFYASVVQSRVRRAAMCTEGQVNACSPRVETEKPIRPKWALLIAKIFRTHHIACPRDRQQCPLQPSPAR